VLDSEAGLAQIFQVMTLLVPVVLVLLSGFSAQTSISLPTGSPPHTVLEVTQVIFDIAWQHEYLYPKVQADGTSGVSDFET